MNPIIATVLLASMSIYGVAQIPSSNHYSNEKVITTNSQVHLPLDGAPVSERISTGTPHPDTLKQSTTHKPEDQHGQQNLQSQSESTGGKGSRHEASNKGPQHPILQKLGLSDCDISQGELNHHKDWNGKSGGHVFATDIVCTPGEIFKVQAPDEYPFYLVQHIGTDQNLGTYVILKHGDVRFVLGHTDNRLEAGSTLYSAGNRINAGDTVGWVNESGNTGGVHLHIEKWIGKNNVTMSGDRINEFSSKLCQQRGWSFCSPPKNNRKAVLEGASEFVRQLEGLRLEAYEDPKGSGRYSIGIGTPSFKGEKITQAEALARYEARINKTVDLVMGDFPDFNTNQQIALVSLAYNCGIKGYPRLKAEGLKVYSDPDFCTLPGHAGLVKRRAAEKKLLFQ